jgi:hypothetical protein
MRLDKRTLLGGGAAAIGASIAPRAFSQPARVHHVREFGAKGDGITNDTAALAAAARFIEGRGGGTLEFDRRTYVIGRQRFDVTARGWAYEPADVVAIRNCSGKVTIVGNGAVLRSARGLRFGAFDPLTGRPSRRELPLYDTSYLASPFRAAILLESNRGGIEVSGFEIDGRISDQIIGGKWGDTGWQVPHHGLNMVDNHGPQRISNVYAHHLGGDGIMYLAVIKNERAPPVPTQIVGCRCEYNGRQGLTIIGGRGITVVRSRFSHTGKNGVIDSNPHAGLDVEAEGSLIRDVAFTDCEFVDNAGAGFVADSGNSGSMTFRHCHFVGSSNYAIWPNKPGIRFEDSVIVGAAVAFYSEANGPGLAPRFLRCRFTDDPALSPTRRVFGKQVDLGASTGVTFDDCDFDYRSMALPATQRHTRFHNCRMSSPAPGKAQLNGIFTGENIIRGGADLSASDFHGRVIYNGRVLSGGSR